MSSEFEIINDILIVKISGEVDHHSVSKARGEIDCNYIASGCRHIVFDFSQVSFADSSGIALIIGRYNITKEEGGTLVITGCHKLLEKILEMAGVFTIIKKLNSNIDAIKYIKYIEEGTDNEE